MAATKRLNSLDWSFLAGETRESMMHVGGLMTFTPPADASPDFLRQLIWRIKILYFNLSRLICTNSFNRLRIIEC